MRMAWLMMGLWLASGWEASAQAVPTKNKEEIFSTPRDAIAAKRNRNFNDDEYYGYMANFARDTMDSDVKIRQNVVTSEQTPFWSRRSVWADETMPRRAATFGRGPDTRDAMDRPTLDDRIAASQVPESFHATRPREDAILAAVYRHFFGYRAQGFGREARDENARLKVGDVYFVGLGPHITDVAPSFLAALQKDPDLLREKITLRPLSKLLEVTNEEIRDRDTGAFGPAFRVDDIGLEENGEVRVMASFTEREGFWFTREFTLRPAKAGAWEVVRDADYATR